MQNAKQSRILYIAKIMHTPTITPMHILFLSTPIAFNSSYNELQSSLLRRFSTRCWSMALGICVHLPTRALVRSGAVVEMLRKLLSSSSNLHIMSSWSCAGESSCRNMFGPLSSHFHRVSLRAGQSRCIISSQEAAEKVETYTINV